MDQEKRFTTFKEFWPFYLGEHSKPGTKTVHFWGTTVGMLVFIFLCLTARWELLPVVLIIIYGPLFISHALIEKNKPATLTYPFFSILGDLKLWYLILTGKIKIK